MGGGGKKKKKNTKTNTLSAKSKKKKKMGKWMSLCCISGSLKWIVLNLNPMI